jgi:hypothetical protein
MTDFTKKNLKFSTKPAFLSEGLPHAHTPGTT